MTRLVAAFLVGLFLLASPTRAWAKWTRLSTPHFVFVGDASESELRGMAVRLELFRDVVTRVFSDQATSSTVPTVVVVFQSERSFRAFRPLFKGRPVSAAGYFVSAEDQNTIAVNAEQDTDASGVIFHEYAHFLVHNSVGEVPVWANEGLAQVYQTFIAEDGGRTATLGRKDLGATYILRRSSAALMPIAELIAVDDKSPLYNEGDRRTLFYAQSWALVHYLTFGAPERRGQFRQYLSLLRQGVTADDAFTKAFGPDRQQLTRELQRYVLTPVFAELKMEFNDALGGGAPAPTEAISDEEAQGYLGDLLARIERSDDARAYLKKTLDAHPASARALASMGLIELRASKLDEASALLGRAAELAPGVASIQAAYGRVVTRQADRGGAEEDALYAKARVALARALELDPGNVSTKVTLAEVEMGSAENPARAVALMRQVVAAEPGREEYRLMLAQALSASGDYRGGANLLGGLMTRGSTPEVRTAAREALVRVAAAENAARRLVEAASAAAPPTPTSESPRPDALQGVFVPSLRPLQTGEVRVFGAFTLVDCRPGAIVMEVDTAGAALRMAVERFDQVSFLSYREDVAVAVRCGPQRPAYRVLATYRSDLAPLAGAGTPNRAVAVEVLPDGYVPK